MSSRITELLSSRIIALVATATSALNEKQKAASGERFEETKKGISENDLSNGQQTFRNLQMLTAAQQKETGEAQQATVARDNAYDALHEWMSDFYKTAKVALRKYPQMMEKLGIKEK
ncbi:MAG: hypothetical protein ABI169_06695 [Chitinophagaceae bacterium]